MNITTERNPINGAIQCTTIYHDEYYHFQYYGYTKKEAKEEFKKFVIKEDNKIIREQH